MKRSRGNGHATELGLMFSQREPHTSRESVCVCACNDAHTHTCEQAIDREILSYSSEASSAISVLPELTQMPYRFKHVHARLLPHNQVQSSKKSWMLRNGCLISIFKLLSFFSSV